MGKMTAIAIAESHFDIKTQLSYHLTHNHYPPLPIEILGVCLEAIEKANEGQWDERVLLPEGTYYRGDTSAPVWSVIEAHHLHAWLSEEV
jgi:hypothetical protein